MLVITQKLGVATDSQDRGNSSTPARIQAAGLSSTVGVKEDDDCEVWRRLMVAERGRG